MSHYYLNSQILSEPLFAQWYAWCHLISPATAALNISNYKIPLLESYIRAPNEHAASLKSAELKGGFFVDAEGHNCISQAEKLLSDTKIKADDLIVFSQMIKTLNSILQKEGITACSMRNVYEKVPTILKGYVELTYDINNYASFRILESLLYRSKFYKPELQSIKLSLGNVDKRPFVLSTPRFISDESVHIQKQFSHSIYNKIFSSRYKPITKTQLFEIIDEAQISNPERMLEFFVETSLTSYPIPQTNKNDAFQVKYFGHATLLIECGETNILLDPLISNDNAYEGIERFSYRDLPDKINFVIITHAHLDHLSLETLLQLRYKIETIIVPSSSRGDLQDPSMKLFLTYCGFKNVIELDELESIEFQNGYIQGIPFFGEHADLDIAKLAYAISYEEKTILCMADSDNLEPELYQHIKEELKKIDAIFLGMECHGAPLTWLYGPVIMSPLTRQANQSRRLNGSDSQRAYALINTLETAQVYIYAMGTEPWIQYISSVTNDEDSIQMQESNKLIHQCERRNIKAKRLYGKELLII